jgi:hypothetical protein
MTLPCGCRLETRVDRFWNRFYHRFETVIRREIIRTDASRCR